MLINLKFILLKKILFYLLLNNIKFYIFLLYNIKNLILIKFFKNFNFIFFKNKLLKASYNLFLKINNFNFVKIFIFYNNNFIFSNFCLPKKYSLFTLLKSPHTDKRSREQFHLISYKSTLKYPLFLSVYNSNFINIFFFFEKGFNIVLKKHILI